MIIKCKNCGTASNYREYGKMENEDRIVQICTCMCGRARHQVFWKIDGSAEWQDGKLISTSFDKEMLDKTANL